MHCQTLACKVYLSLGWIQGDPSHWQSIIDLRGTLGNGGWKSLIIGHQFFWFFQDSGTNNGQARSVSFPVPSLPAQNLPFKLSLYNLMAIQLSIKTAIWIAVFDFLCGRYPIRSERPTFVNSLRQNHQFSIILRFLTAKFALKSLGSLISIFAFPWCRQAPAHNLVIYRMET